MYHYKKKKPVNLQQALNLYRKVQSSKTKNVSQKIRKIKNLL